MKKQATVATAEPGRPHRPCAKPCPWTYQLFATIDVLGRPSPGTCPVLRRPDETYETRELRVP